MPQLGIIWCSISHCYYTVLKNTQNDLFKSTFLAGKASFHMLQMMLHDIVCSQHVTTGQTCLVLCSQLQNGCTGQVVQSWQQIIGGCTVLLSLIIVKAKCAQLVDKRYGLLYKKALLWTLNFILLQQMTLQKDIGSQATSFVLLGGSGQHQVN